MARLTFKRRIISFSEVLSVFKGTGDNDISGTELRISLLSSYIFVLLSFIVIPPNLVIAYQTNDIIGIVILIILSILILSAAIIYWKTRSYTVLRGILTAAMVVIIIGIILKGGGSTGVGLFYVFVLTPFFYFILGWVVAALLPIVIILLVLLRFHVFGVDSSSVFLIPKVGDAFGLAFGIGVFFIYGTIITIRALTNSLSQMAYRDAVTGLPNRNKIMEVLQQRIDSAQIDYRPEKKAFGIIGLELGHFNRAAATLDMERADLILKTVAQRLLSILPKSTFLGRFSGSVFVVIADTSDLNELHNLASKILSAVGPNKQRDEYPLVPSAVITSYPSDGELPDRLLGNIMATLQNRNHFEGGPILYNSMHYQREAERLKMAELLPGAIERGEIYLVYHPRLSVDEGWAVGAEVLLRWKNPILGEVAPSKFIPVAEELEIIRDITRWVLSQVGKESEKIHRYFPDRSLIHGVNLSSYDLASPGLFDRIESWRKEFGFSASKIEFEITEGMLVDDNPTVKNNLDKLGKHGFRLSIDDFGTGYSNFRYLQRFNVNAVKIDQSFIRDISHDTGAQHIVKAIISLTASLGMECVAEGVETQQQFKWLREVGCQYVQGYYFGKPFRLKEYIDWLENRRLSKSVL